MLRFSRIILVLLVVAVMAFFLPGLFWKAFDQKVNSPLILYSVVQGEFVYRQSNEYGTVIYSDESGNEYDRIAYENLLPFFYYRDLHKWGTLPEELGGMAVDYEICRHNMQTVRIRPDYLHTPKIDIYPLYESESQFANLEDPPEMFRLTDRMEFIEAAGNRVMEEKSALFTGALEKAGFVFPRRYISGNPTTRKPFDEGYFVVDDEGTLFQVKQVKGEPWVKNTGIRPESGIRYMNIRENSRREFYGLLITGEDQIHLISCNDYELIELPLEGYDPDTMSLWIVADLLNRTFVYKEGQAEEIHCVLTDLDYHVVRTYTHPVDRGQVRFAKSLSELLFPFTLESEIANSDYIRFDFMVGGLLGLAGILAALIILAIVRRARSIKLSESPFDWILVALTGPYGLVALLVVGREPPSP